MKNLFEEFDRLNKTNTVKKYEYKRRIFEHENLMNLLENKSLNESYDEERERVVEMIKNDEFDENVHPKDFYDSMMASKHPLMLTDYSVGELSEMKLFKLPEYKIGYALKKHNDNINKYNEIVAVHNNEENIGKIGDELIQSAVRNGGCYLDHFDGFLSSFYEKNGFEEYKREDYNPEYDDEGAFKNKYGEQDVIYRIHKSCK